MPARRGKYLLDEAKRLQNEVVPLQYLHGEASACKTRQLLLQNEAVPVQYLQDEANACKITAAKVIKIIEE